MPSHEATILSDFLLAPAALRDVLTLKQFTDIFPKAHRSSPAIKELYQELHRQRGQDIERVRQNIAEEVKRSRKLKRDCARERQHEERTAVAGLDPIALGIEEELSGHALRKKPHTLQSIHPSIEEACESIEAHIAKLEAEIGDVFSEVQEAVGELSDLRYGSFPKSAGGGDIGEEVLSTLKRLESACTNPAG